MPRRNWGGIRLARRRSKARKPHNFQLTRKPIAVIIVDGRHPP